MTEPREHWSGRLGFVLATVGSAVGLGSIWKFPYEVGTNGGGAFVLFYLVGLALVVLPLMLAEFAIGRRGQADAAESIARVAAACGATRRWAAIGTLGVVTAVLILSFYAVIGGWALAYAVETVTHGLAGAAPAAVKARFEALLGAPGRMMVAHAVFLGLTTVIVARGIAHGIEAASRVLMPALALLIVLLALYGLATGDVAATLKFLFVVDPAKLTARAALEALGLGFFSIGVGLAIMITYAAYAERGIDLAQVALVTIVGDTAISVLAGFAVFPVVFANGLDPASGPGLMFVTLPLAFARMPFGAAVAVAFFVLLVVAALASAISLLEMPVALLQRRLGWPRARAAIAAALVTWAAGLATVFSFNLWAGWHPLGAIPWFSTATVFDLVDHLTSNALLPVGGLALALFAGWALPARPLAEELGAGPRAIALLRFLLRWIAPAAIAATALLPLVT